MLTLFRILCCPVVVWLLYQRTDMYDTIAGVVFGVASITDFFDGYIARTRKQETVYGKLMDPLADKFLVVTALILLQELGRIHPVIVIVLICREMAITGLRAIASAEGVVIPASASAKWKTTTQMFALPFLMVPTRLWGLPFLEMGMILLWISIGISLVSALHYVTDFFKILRAKTIERIRNRREGSGG